MPKPLKIAVDVRDLRLAKTGTRTYLLELCNEFKKLESADLQFCFLDTILPVYTGNNKLLKLIEHARYQFWKQVALPLKAFFKGCDIVFCTDNVVPLLHLGFKTVPVFHDAFFFESPQNYGKLWLSLYKKTALPAARRAAAVVTPSAWAKRQISHYTNIAADKLAVIYEGPKTKAATNSDNQLLKHLSLNPQKYLLHVGSMFKRKNLPALVYAFSKIKADGYPDLKLVLAGPIPSTAVDNDHQAILDAIKETNLQNDVVLAGYLNDASIGQLYQNALAYVFPSVNEGFGIPVLEAFNNDIPVLVANNTCLPEIGGNAVVLFDPFDMEDISAKIKMVLTDADLQQNMIVKGRERLKSFSWSYTAQQLVTLFKNVA